MNRPQLSLVNGVKSDDQATDDRRILCFFVYFSLRAQIVIIIIEAHYISVVGLVMQNMILLKKRKNHSSYKEIITFHDGCLSSS